MYFLVSYFVIGGLFSNVLPVLRLTVQRFKKKEEEEEEKNYVISKYSEML